MQSNKNEYKISDSESTLQNKNFLNNFISKLCAGFPKIKHRFDSEFNKNHQLLEAEEKSLDVVICTVNSFQETQSEQKKKFRGIKKFLPEMFEWYFEYD